MGNVGVVLAPRKTKMVSKLAFVLLSLLVRIQMDIIYATYLVTKWGYQSFSIDINVYKIAFSYVLLVLFLGMLRHYKPDRISHFSVVVLFYTMYMPVGTLYGLMNRDTSFFAIVNVIFFILVVFTIFVNDRFNWQIMPDRKITSKLHIVLILLSIATFLGMTIQNINHLDIRSVLNLTKVYAIRRLVDYRWGMNYLFSLQTKVINPYMIALHHLNGNKVMKRLYLLFQLWLYVLTGHKMVLFTLIMITVIFRFKHKLDQLTQFFVSGIAFSMTISAIELVFFQKSFLIDLVIRRVFYIPALLNFHYFDFFSNNGFQLWKHSLFGRIMGARVDFDVLPSFVIGEQYFNNIETNAVTGFLGSEYMNGGFLGLLMTAGILIILLKVLDRFAHKLGVVLTLVTFLTPLYTIWNTAFLTALLTGGILLSVMVLFFTESSGEKMPHS